MLCFARNAVEQIPKMLVFVCCARPGLEQRVANQGPLPVLRYALIQPCRSQPVYPPRRALLQRTVTMRLICNDPSSLQGWHCC